MRVHASPACWAGSLIMLLAGPPPTAAAQQGGAGRLPVTFSGEIRVRSEADGRTPGVGHDFVSLLRTRVALVATPSTRVRALVRLSDSRVFGEETNTLTDASADRLDLHEAFLEWAREGGVRLRVGRQEWAYGDERLIGTVGWANVTRSFDGVQVRVPVGSWTVDGFAAALREFDATGATGLDPRQNEGRARDQSLFGLWASGGSSYDLFLIAESRVAGSGRHDVFRRTAGGHAAVTIGGFVLDGTAAAQWGTERGDADDVQRSLSAWFASLAVTRALEGPLHPRVTAQADVLSGDADPSDTRDGAFNTLYATNHKFYGFMDLILDPAAQLGGRGLVDAAAKASIQPDGWRLALDLHRFWLARRVAPAGSKVFGSEADATASRTLAPGLGLVTGASVFRPGGDGTAPTVGLGQDTLWWGYLQLTVTF